MKIWTTIETILQTTPPQSLTVTHDGKTVFDGDRIYYEMKNYETFSILHSAGTDAEIIYGIVWRQFCLEHAAQYARLIDAFNREYNPLNNYEMHETEITGNKWAKHTTTTATNGGASTDSYENAMDDTTTNGNHKSRTATTDNTTTATETTAVHDVSLTYDTTTPDGFVPETATGYNAGVEHKTTRAGNLGVTTAADMLTKEKELRGQIAFVAEFVAMFINKYCVYVGGCE